MFVRYEKRCVFVVLVVICYLEGRLQVIITKQVKSIMDMVWDWYSAVFSFLLQFPHHRKVKQEKKHAGIFIF